MGWVDLDFGRGLDGDENENEVKTGEATKKQGRRDPVRCSYLDSRGCKRRTC